MTNTRKAALIALRDKVKAGEHVFPRNAKPAFDGKEWLEACRAALGSLDAALALHNAVLPEWIWDVTNDHAFVMNGLEGPQFAPDDFMDDNPARAWLLAILEALIAQEARP